MACLPPRQAMILPASKEEGKLIKKRYAGGPAGCRRALPLHPSRAE